MDIQQHVPKLETCQKLQEAGWEKFTPFAWSEDGELIHRLLDDTTVEYPAPLLSELLEELPKDTLIEKKYEDIYRVHVTLPPNEWVYLKHCPNSVEAAALLWLELVDEGILTL